MLNDWIAIVARSFIDTNILLYSNDEADTRKNRMATELLVSLYGRREAVLSIQVLQEYAVNALKKLKMEPSLVRRRVELFGRFDVVIPSVSLVTDALDLQLRYPLSFWDALVVQSAVVSGCAILFSENLQHERVIDGVRIINPFAET